MVKARSALKMLGLMLLLTLISAIAFTSKVKAQAIQELAYDDGTGEMEGGRKH